MVYKPAPKVATKLNTKVTTTVITKPLPKTKTPASKIVAKLPASSAVKTTAASGQAAFAPEVLTAGAFPASVNVSEPVYLSAPSTQHYRVGAILGKAAQVRFTPIESTWNFGDGTSGSGANPAHKFASPGTYSATVAVKYLVSYRLAGQTNWITDAAQITLTDQVQITVANASQPGSESSSQAVPQQPYLVGENCIRQPLAFAC